jgi:hypothetical protein
MAATDTDADTIPDAELLAMPGEGIPAGRLTAFFTRRAALLHQHELDELALERSGNSARHFIIFADMDPKARAQREEEARRRAWQEEQERLAYIERSDRLLVQIEDRQRAIEIRRKEIEDNALRLHDGRRVYVDGGEYRDEQGRVLTGADRDEAAGQHRLHPEASTWAERQKAIDDAEEAKRLKDKILKGREGGEGTMAEKTERLSGYEQEFAQQIQAHAAQPVADYGSGEYMAELGGEWKLSTVPAFTEAASFAKEATGQPSDRDSETDETKPSLRPASQGAFKL